MCRAPITVCGALVLLLPLLARADDAPREGTLVGYFFVDRWCQPYFDPFYVQTGLAEPLIAGIPAAR